MCTMLFLTFFMLLFHSTELNVQLKELSLFLHRSCVQLAPNTHNQNLYQALVCGTQLTNPNWKITLQASSLIHLIVVSGSHLVFIENLLNVVLKKYTHKKIIIGLLLGFYTLIALLQAPVLRAFIQYLYAEVSNRKKLFLPSHLITFFSGLIVICIFPNNMGSYSLLLSWGASFALTLNSEHEDPVHKQIWIFLILFPLLLPLMPQQPVSIIFNIIFAPLLGAILFPLCILVFLIPRMAPITDFIIDHLMLLLQQLTLGLTQPAYFQLTELVQIILWIYMTTLQITYHLTHIYRAQRV